uniref:Uncharacterized mitochondrial protein AtMg00810-like n=1 Tax=Nicotiana tabacum TaxID=4097 RepID=A0A1S3Z0P0_TOBAC|nr:PREDICTED: uncharacterized mitochondrial protein AtMg00810-like [Nicotiana tabacum]
MKDLDELKFFLGIEFARSNKGIFMYQRKYALELIAEADLEGAKPVGTLLELNQKLITVKYDECIKHKESSEDKQLEDPSSYQRLVGRLLYLTMTIPDIAFAVQDIMSNSLPTVTLTWGACIETRRSVTRYLVKFGKSLVSWKSKKQNTVSRQSLSLEAWMLIQHKSHGW